MFSLTYLPWIAIAAVVLNVAALLSILRSDGHSPKARLVWTAITLLIPIVGALAWFALGRERRR